MKFGIIKERKNPPDRRVVFTPEEASRLLKEHPEVELKVESSDIRIFNDDEYRSQGLNVTDDISDCDVFFGVKEVPVEALIPGKKYFFFSHTIKKQPHNRKLLQAILEKNIDLYDHETIVDTDNRRLIGFGRYAGIVGAYNGIRAFGIKFELFNLPKAETLSGKSDLVARLKRQILPPIKIVLTGHGKVGMGAKEILDGMKVKEVTPEDFLSKKYTQPVYTQIDVLDYNKRIDGKVIDKEDFYNNPQDYTSDFERFSKVADIFMAGHFYGNGAPVILTREMLNSKDNKIKIVADISCDVDGPIASTIKASTIAEPLYGYLPSEHKEVEIYHPAAIVVMAVDNLPCELPKDASEGFGEMFMEHVIPAFFNGDKDGILQRAKITENGKLTKRFEYLQPFVDGK
ncbi:NAD(P)-dependent oxidoreductase [Flavobacterium lindanitolerans]|jgi:alanine dehydrogenase|uniref:Saccharopine dehydrogenase [NAD(+), L-lysine-forming] n=1 Tax=Flavobacterium lindanitolerans TaxID=428988 RepID=A0A497UHF3_9FLAO|nr:NAD(P)-dependent oxidoreductase [Flavobacterium lindanitolerans]MBL7868010.1 alanine dehydrogenase [Flavobacterium lindanitolerans]PKW21080.1 alanine dehydrogenase [Flavobacterium lindanitolerans]RLJ30281.1 alanine dehydrogenase [Flavobacterium lindanitolerans]THD31876.1 MAG: alanine dehydrogenase [Flavobacterium johnsoniae]